MGAVFGVFGGFFYWIHKMTGATYKERLGQAMFWTLFVGVNLTFFPMHFMGLAGMPRRIPDYPDEYWFWNSVASFGSLVSVVAVYYFVKLLCSLRVPCWMWWSEPKDEELETRNS